jgi:predicted MFS family arabinose efflux permease
MDRNKESVEWATYFSMTDLSSAAFAVIGGFVVSYYGFNSLIFAVSGITLLGTSIMLPIKSYMSKRDRRMSR